MSQDTAPAGRCKLIREIDGFEDYVGYRIWDDGRVESQFGKGHSRAGERWRLLRATKFKNGYRYVSLVAGGRRKKFILHRLLLLAFGGPCPNGQEARHLDCDRDNNCASNLAWGTRTQNMADSIRNGRTRTGERHWNCKLTDEQVREIRRRAALGELQRVLALEFGVARSAISNIVRRKNRVRDT